MKVDSVAKERTIVPKRRQKHYSYDESLDEANGGNTCGRVTIWKRLDDALLRDIGLSRSEAGLASKPSWIN